MTDPAVLRCAVLLCRAVPCCVVMLLLQLRSNGAA
jgi:hypothetical protein